MQDFPQKLTDERIYSGIDPNNKTRECSHNQNTLEKLACNA